MDDWEVFFYDEEEDRISSLTKYHAESSSVEHILLHNLVEAHPDVIYFYARLQMHKDWDFNEVALPNEWTHNHDEPLFVIEEK